MSALKSMSTVSTVTLKGLWFHKLRYALTGLAVILGVAFMAGTSVLTDTMEKTFNGVIEQANEGIDVIVRHNETLQGVETRQRVDASLIDGIAAVDGVAAVNGSIQGFAQLVNADGSVAGANGLGATIGTNWIADQRLNPLTLDAGRAPAAAGEAVLDKGTADKQGWQLGDHFTVLAKDGPSTLTLVGTARFGATEGLPGMTMVATDDATAQRLFAEPGRYDSVVVAAQAGTSAAELAARIDAQLSGTPAAAGIEVVTGQQDTVDQQAQLKHDLSFFNEFLMAFAWISLFVGTFIIYNTFSIVVAQRTKDLAMLRAIGARRGQVLRSVVLEAAIVGVVSAAIGLAAGVGLSYGLRELLAVVGLDIPSGPIVISSATIVTAFVVGTLVSVLSALVPALRAGRVRPIAALRDAAVDRSGLSVARVIVGLLVAAGGVLGFAAGSVAKGTSALPLVGLGAMGVILGVFTLGPVLVRPAVRVLGVPAGIVSGFTGRYARQNAHRTPKRTTATASALMIGVALVGFITILATSTKSSLDNAIDRSFRADYVIDSGSWDRGFSPAIEDGLSAVDQVAVISPLRTTPAAIDGTTTELTAVDTKTFDELYNVEVAAGSLEAVGEGGIAVNSDIAAEKGLAMGDPVTVRFAGGDEVALVVRSLFDADIAGAASDWLVDVRTFDAHVADRYDRKLFVGLADGVSASAGRAAIDQAMVAWPNADVQDQAEFKESITGEIDRMLNLIYGLLALAVVIALIGVANTMALSVHERTRELGLLRAVGMHRRQLRTAVRWESVMIALLGALTGAALAVGGAWGIIRALDDEGVTTLTLPTTRLLVIMAVAGLAGVAAATGPARRAARLDILQAIATE